MEVSKLISRFLALTTVLLVLWVFRTITPESLLIPLAFFVPGCYCCGSTNTCTYCSGSVPNSYQVVITGISVSAGTFCDPPPAGDACSTYNGTYLCDTYSFGGISPDTGCCVWLSPTFANKCWNAASNPLVQVTVSVCVSQIVVAFAEATVRRQPNYIDSITTPIDCMAYSSTNVTFANNGPSCVSSGAAAKLTAI